MKHIAFLILPLTLLSACGKDNSDRNRAPTEMVGTWVADGVSNTQFLQKTASSRSVVPTGVSESETEECQNVSPTLNSNGGDFDAGIMKIDSSGTVTQAILIGGTDLSYVVRGKVFGNRRFTATPGMEQQYLQQDLSSAVPGTTSVPLIYFKYSNDLAQVPTLEMEIQVSISGLSGFYTSPVLSRRYFRKISNDLEQTYLDKAAQCAFGKGGSAKRLNLRVYTIDVLGQVSIVDQNKDQIVSVQFTPLAPDRLEVEEIFWLAQPAPNKQALREMT